MSYTLAELAKCVGADLIGDGSLVFTGVDSLETAGPSSLSFLANPLYSSYLKTTRAGAVCIDRKTPPLEGKNYLVSDRPSDTFQALVKLLLPSPTPTGFIGIHPTALIHPSAQIAENVSIGPYAVIDQNSLIGKGTQIGAHVSIGAGVQIGEECLLYPHSCVREDCILGHRVILQSGAVIGSCGFGYVTNARGEHTKLEQLGRIILEDDVEIGANTTIDRGRFKETRIGKGSKIDNLVQIGHNVNLGPHNIIVSQTGIAGSSSTGRNVVMGGQAGVVGHVEIADFVRIGTRGGVSKSLPQKGDYAGGPVMPLADHNKMQVHLRKIEEYVKEIKELRKRIEDLEKN